MTTTWENAPAPPGAKAYEPKRDRWGRYLLPNPDTGKEQAWTRVTTFAKSVADLHGLNKWQQRMTAKGLVARPDLFAQAASLPDDDRRGMDRVCDDAKEAAAASAGANMGTALHTFTERLDRGEGVTVPPPWNLDTDAYVKAMDRAGVAVRPAWVERIVCVPELGVAGTLDRIVDVAGWLAIADLKTGKDLRYSWGEIAIQLALYAHSAGLWDPEANAWEPMPEVDLDTAMVMHLAAGTATCDLYRVDIAAGWSMAGTCKIVREWRTRKDLAQPWAAEHVDRERRPVDQAEAVDWPTLSPSGSVGVPAASAASERASWVVDRLAILVVSDYARALLGQVWPADVERDPATWNAGTVERLAAMCDYIESVAGAPFPPRDPEAEPVTLPAYMVIGPERTSAPEWCGTDTGTMATEPEVAAVVTMKDALPPERVELAARWFKEGRAVGRSFDRTPEGMTERAMHVARAAFRCALDLWEADAEDQWTRAALAVVTADRGDLSPDWSVGAVLGSLSILEAARLEGLVDRFASGDAAAITTIVEAAK